MTLYFGLPDVETRQKVLERYAKHLKGSDLKAVASEARGMSCRDLKEVTCDVQNDSMSSIVAHQRRSEMCRFVNTPRGNGRLDLSEASVSNRYLR